MTEAEKKAYKFTVDLCRMYREENKLLQMIAGAEGIMILCLFLYMLIS